MKVSKEWKIAWFTIVVAPLVASIWDFIKSGNQFNFQSLKIAYQWFISGKLPVWMVVLLLISVLLISWFYRSLKSRMSEIQTNIDDTELIENRQFLNDHMECPRCEKAFTKQNTHEIMTLIKDNVRRSIEQYQAGN